MFVETITSPKEAWDDWNEKLKLHSDPPSALFASIAWSSGDGMVTQVNVWDAPGAVSDFYMKRVLRWFRRKVNLSTSQRGTVNP